MAKHASFGSFSRSALHATAYATDTKQFGGHCLIANGLGNRVKSYLLPKSWQLTTTELTIQGQPSKLPSKIFVGIFVGILKTLLVIFQILHAFTVVFGGCSATTP